MKNTRAYNKIPPVKQLVHREKTKNLRKTYKYRFSDKTDVFFFFIFVIFFQQRTFQSCLKFNSLCREMFFHCFPSLCVWVVLG